MTLARDEDIFRFQIPVVARQSLSTPHRRSHSPVNDTSAMQSFDPLNNLRTIKSRSISPESTPPRELRSEITTVVEIKREVERVGVVERIVHSDDKGIRLVGRTALEDLLFRDGVLELSMGEDLRAKCQRRATKRDEGQT